jgi:hypothetical protein
MLVSTHEDLICGTREGGDRSAHVIGKRKVNLSK